jgi:hypothetical protein
MNPVVLYARFSESLAEFGLCGYATWFATANALFD